MQNLISSDNPISMRLWWIWDLTVWLGVKKHRHDKVQNIRVCTKYKR